MTKLFVALVAAAFMVIPSVVSANLLGDPGFEGSGTGPWSYYESNAGFNQNFDATTYKHSGSQALKIKWTSVPANNISETKQELAVTAGQTYYAEVYAKVTAALKNNAKAYLETIFVNASGAEVGRITSNQLSAVTNWTKLTNSGIVPAGAVIARYRLIAYVAGSTSTGGTVYFDDAYIPGPRISNIQVTNATQASATVTWQTDIASDSSVRPRGFYKIYDTQVSPGVRVQGVTYVPVEEHGPDITAAEIDKDLQDFAANNVNVVNIYNLADPALEKADSTYNTLEERIFAKCVELGMKFVVRLENYDGPNFNWGYEDADWIIDTRYAYTINRAQAYSSGLFYYNINMPLDDPALPKPSESQQRDYVSYFYNRMKAIDPDGPVFVNFHYGSMNEINQASVADIVDGITFTQYAVRCYPAPYGVNYDTNSNGSPDPWEGPVSTDPDYKILDKDQFDYYVDKLYIRNDIGSYGGTKKVYLDSGFAELLNHWSGICADRTTKLKAMRLLNEYVENSPQLNGWIYFKAYDKYEIGGEQGTYGIFDTKIQGNAPEAVTNHTVVLTDLFPGTAYEVWAMSDESEAAGPSFTTLPATAPSNDTPTITITSPAYGGVAVDSGENVAIAWRDEDTDNNAVISLYYDIDDRGHDGTLIVSGINEDDPANSYIWNTADLLPRKAYYIYAKIDDGVNPPEYDYSNGEVSIYPFGSASSVQSQGLEAEKAFDGDAGTRWSSFQGLDPQWIQMDFGSPVEIYKVVLNWEAAYGRSYEIQTSNGVLGSLYVNGASTEAAFVPNTLIKPFAAFNATQKDRYTLNFNIDSLTSSATYDVALDIFNSNKAYIGTVWNVFPTSGTSTATGPQSVNLGSLAFDPNTAYIMPKMTVHTAQAAQTVYIGGMSFIYAPTIWDEDFYDVSDWSVSYDPLGGSSIGTSNGNSWITIYSTTTGDGGIDDIDFTPVRARYIRMYGTQRGTSYGYSLWEFEVGVSTTIAFSSSSENASVSAAKAVDSNPATRWASAFTDSEWICLDFGSSRTFDTVKLLWEAAYGRQYEIQISDNAVNWTTIYTETNSDGGEDSIYVGDRTARYVKMQGIQRATQWGYSLWEFKALKATASSVQDNYPLVGADKAVDSNMSTRWSSSQGSDNEWIYIDHMNSVRFNTVKLNWEASYGRQYEIQISDNAVNWTTIYTETNSDGGEDSIYVGDRTARYVKMQGIQRATQWGYSLWEFKAE